MISPGGFMKWFQSNIESNNFFSEGIDFIQLPVCGSAVNSNHPRNYALSIEMAKYMAFQDAEIIV